MPITLSFQKTFKNNTYQVYIRCPYEGLGCEISVLPNEPVKGMLDEDLSIVKLEQGVTLTSYWQKISERKTKEFKQFKLPKNIRKRLKEYKSS